MNVGRYEQALESYEQMLATGPSNLTALANKGKAYYYLGRHEDAIACFDRALAFNPINACIWHNKAIGLRNLGRNKEADDCIKMADYTAGKTPLPAFLKINKKIK